MKKISFWVFLAVVYISMSAAKCTPDPIDPITPPEDKDTDTDTIVDNGKEETINTPANHLVAYFPFDNNANPTVGVGITYDKKGSNASFVKGKVGNAYQGAATDAYLAYNLATPNVFSSLKSFTIAAWIKTSATNVAAAPIVMVNGGSGDQGTLNFMIESNSDADGLELKGFLFNETAEWQGHDLRVKNPLFLIDKWIYVSYSYNEDNSTIALHVNGQLVEESTRYASGEENNFPVLGALTLKPGNKMFIGAWERAIGASEYPEPWMTFYPGLLDELRIYDKALSTTEIANLYSEEQAKATNEPEDTKENPSNIAASNLIAHFPFESASNPLSATGITFAEKGAGTTFPKGRRGNAFQGSEDGSSYLAFNLAAGNKLVAAKEYSLAFWMKSPKVDGAKGIFSVNKGDIGMGSLNLLLDNSNNYGGDTVRLKSYLYNTTTEWRGQDLNTWSLLANTWHHVIVLYRVESSTMEIFVNGILKIQDTRYAGPVDEVSWIQTELGPLTLDQTSDKLYFGVWDPNGEPQDWKLPYPGQIDEFRIYNKALSESEIQSLYHAEVSQIND